MYSNSCPSRCFDNLALWNTIIKFSKAAYSTFIIATDVILIMHKNRHITVDKNRNKNFHTVKKIILKNDYTKKSQFFMLKNILFKTHKYICIKNPL